MRLKFLDFDLDTQTFTIRQAGSPIGVEPQVFDILRYFATNPSRVITRDELVREIWDGRAISDSTISARIALVRKVLGRKQASESILRTVPKRGFRFDATVERLMPDRTNVVEEQLPNQRQSIHFTKSRDGTRIAYAVSGDGPPMMRAGHFLTHLEREWTSELWQPMLRAFSNHFRLVRYDQRTTGLSDRGAPALDLDALVDDLLAVADASGLDSFPIYATSQGVPVALKFSVLYPERVTRMVLHGGFAQGRLVRGGEAAKAEAEAVLTLIRQGWGTKVGAFSKAFSTLYMPDASSDLLEHMAQLQLASASPEGAARFREAIDTLDVLDILPKVSVPVMIVHADEDSVQPLAQAQILASEIPGAEFTMVRGRNHVLIPEELAWRETIETAIRFLSA